MRPLGQIPLGSQSFYNSSYAVVIGIDEYDDPAHDDLRGAVFDATQVKAALELQGFQVTPLYGHQATREAIARILGDKLPARLHANDRVLVYFSGHGQSVDVGKTTVGYIVPVDGRRSDPVATAIAMEEVRRWSDRYPAKHVMFVADACYGGLAISTTKGSRLGYAATQYLAELTNEPVRYTLVAGRENEVAREDPETGHGVFTRFFLDGIAGAADKYPPLGVVTGQEISEFTKQKVFFYSMTLPTHQTPLSARTGTGEFVFTPGIRLSDRRVADQKPNATRQRIFGLPREVVNAYRAVDFDAPESRRTVSKRIADLEYRLRQTSRDPANVTRFMLLVALGDAYVHLADALESEQFRSAENRQSGSKDGQLGNTTEGMVLKAQKRAIQYFETYLDELSEPGPNGRALHKLGYLYGRLNDHARAIKNYLDLIEQDPDSPYVLSAYLAFGELMFASGACLSNSSEASTFGFVCHQDSPLQCKSGTESVPADVLEVTESEEIRRGESEQHPRHTCFELAEEGYLAVLKNRSSDHNLSWYATYMLAHLYRYYGKWEQSLERFSHIATTYAEEEFAGNAQQLKGTPFEALVRASQENLIVVYAHAGRPEAAISFFGQLSGDRAEPSEATLDTLAAVAYAYVKVGRVREAAQLYREVMPHMKDGELCSFVRQSMRLAVQRDLHDEGFAALKRILEGSCLLP